MADQNPQQPQTPEVNATVKETDQGVIVETQQQEVSIPPAAAPAAQEAPHQASPETPPAADLEQRFQQQQTSETEIRSTLSAAGVDFDALAAEYDRDGALSPKSMEALQKAGYPKPIVDAYLAGLEALSAQYVQEVQRMAGGAEGYQQLASFIRTQPQSVIDGFNDALQTGSLAQIQLAITGLRAQMTAAYGTASPSVLAGQTGAGTPTGYQTTAEMTKDMSDPRYQTDPAFTQEVYRKLQNSILF